jgi:hypothetical protein
MPATPPEGGDNRSQDITITLSAELWDALSGGEGTDYAHRRSELCSLARRLVRERNPGAPNRHAAALAEVIAKRPDVPALLPRIKKAVATYVGWWEAGDFTGVSHLGGGNPVTGTVDTGSLYIYMTPSGVLLFDMRTHLFADSLPYLFTQEEVDLLLSVCEEESGRWLDHWNGEGCATLSVALGARR